jgi:Zn finger protein HypA/HybF involved in hydrogenase expression
LHFILKFIIIKLQKKRRKEKMDRKMKNTEAIKWLKEAQSHIDLEMGGNTQEMYDALELAIKALEERPTGEWIEEPDTLGVIEKGNAKYRCSCCGRTDIQAKSLDVPYCWFCGAEMVEKDIDED